MAGAVDGPGELATKYEQPSQGSRVCGTVAAGLRDREAEQFGQVWAGQDDAMFPCSSVTSRVPGSAAAISHRSALMWPRAWTAVVGSLMPGESALTATSMSWRSPYPMLGRPCARSRCGVP